MGALDHATGTVIGQEQVGEKTNEIPHFAALARIRVAAFIVEYNTVRRHSSLQMISPLQWELAHAITEQEAA